MKLTKKNFKLTKINVWDQVFIQVENQVGSKVRNQVWDQVYRVNRFGLQTKENIKNEIN